MEDVEMISVYFVKLLCIVAEMSGEGEKNSHKFASKLLRSLFEKFKTITFSIEQF